MVYLSVFSFMASILYMYVGFGAISANRRSSSCRVFFCLTLSLAIWSFAGGFVYLAQNPVEYSFWNKISAFGWCTFEAFTLYFVLLITQNKQIRHWYVQLLLMTPAGVFLFMALFLFGPNIDTSPAVEAFFYIGNFIYNFVYLALSIVLVLRWGIRSESKIRKKQAHILAWSSVVPFLLTFVFQQVLPYFGLLQLPNMGQIFTLVMLWGVNHAIIKYQFLSVPTTAITNELFNELTGLTILTDAEGYIIKVNRQVYLFLGCTHHEIVGSHISQLLQHTEITRVFSGCTAMKDRVRLEDISLKIESGTLIPFNITIIPLHSKTDHIGGFLVIGEDIRATKCLEDEITNHKLTNERLRNSEQLFRTLLEVAPVSIFIISQQTDRIRYLNTRAVSLLGEDRCQLIGSTVQKYFVSSQDISFLSHGLLDNKGSTKKEIWLRKADGTQFAGLVTVVTSIYGEEAVTLACVVDMTEQKKTEEALIRNNESIHKLNQELLKMNHLLTNKSIKDSLTNLYNHQYINEVLAAKLKKVEITKESLCVMMMDIDHFKWVNDGFGHQVGDTVLISVAELIQKNIREGDYIGRYGGEEFIVVLPDASMDNACVIAERIRAELESYDFGIENLKVTISIGVANHQGEGLDALVHKADMLLYQAKSNGRNRIETFLEETSQPHPLKA